MSASVSSATTGAIGTTAIFTPGTTGRSATAAPLATAPFALDSTFKLHSNPAYTKKIYLNFTGGTVTGTAWNQSYGESIQVPAFNFEGTSDSFTDNELARIQGIWARVVEDYSPWQVDITTEDPGVDGIQRSDSNDNAYGSRVMIGGTNTGVLPGLTGAGGIAYIGAFSSYSETYKPAFVFSETQGNGEKVVADTIVHEVGHNLGLRHDGTAFQSYYEGHGTGDTGWAPVMGVGFYKNLVQFSKGEYPGANNKEDDLSIITNSNGFGYKPDDFANSLSTARAMPNDVGGSVSFFGQIGQNTDTDWFKFSTRGGAYSLTINPSAWGANLDVRADLYNASGGLVLSNNPVNALSAKLAGTLAAGTYYLKIDGVGKAATATDPGYSDYGSLGQYSVTGSYVPTVATSTITGVGFNDQNDNGVQDTGELGVAGWTVYLDANNNGVRETTEKSTVTDSAGNYSFSGLVAGAYTVREVRPTGWRQTSPSDLKYAVTTTPGQIVTGKNFSNTQKFRISGSVFNDSNNNGVIDNGEAGLSGWNVYLDLNNNDQLDGGEPSQTTASNGTYMFANLAAGNYTLREVTPSGWRQTAPAGSEYAVTGGTGQFITNRNFGNSQNPLTPASNLRVLSVGTTSADLAWNEVSGESSYTIQVSRDGGNSWSTQEDVPADHGYLATVDLSPRTTYQFRVIVNYPLGTSGPSNVVQVTTTDDAPTNLRVLAVRSNGADLAWNEVTGEQSYIMEVSTDGGANWRTQENVPADHAYQDTVTLQPNTSYLFRVRAVYSYGVGSPSNIIQVTTPRVVIPTPTNLRVLDVRSNEIDMAWDEVSGENSYTMQVSTDGGNNWRTQENVPADHAYHDTVTVNPQTAYWFRVVANFDAGTSDPSNVVQATTPPNVVIETPTNLRVLAVRSNEIDLAWDEVNGESSYTMQVSTDGGNSWRTQENVPADHAYHDTVSVNPGTVYWFRVVANYTAGTSGASNVVQVTTPVPPLPVPTNLRVLAVRSNEIDLAWDEVSGESSYTVQVSTDGGNNWRTQENVPADHAYHDTVTVNPSTAYWFRVVANFSSGTSGPSNVVQATTPRASVAGPTNFRVLAVRATEIDLAWNEVSGEDSYTVQVSTDGGNSWRTQENVPANHGYKDTVTVRANTTYWFRVIANFSSGPSDPSNVLKVTTPRS